MFLIKLLTEIKLPKNHSITLQQLIITISLVAGGYLLGLLIEKIVLIRLRRFSEKTKWKGDDIVVHALHHMIIPWFILAGLSFAISYLPFDPAIEKALQTILKVITIILLTIITSRISVGFVRNFSRNIDGRLHSSSILTNITRILIFLLGALFCLQILGVSITPLLTALGVGGLAVALALQDTLSNLFSGLQILVSKQLHIGDYIKLESGEEGYITDITWRNTSIRALTNNMYIVPNSKLANSNIVNYYLPQQELALIIPVGVAYGSDLEKVERVTVETAMDVLQQSRCGVSGYQPNVRFSGFGEYAVNFNLIVRAREFNDQFMLRHEIIKAIHKRFQNEGISIPYPVQVVKIEEKK